MNRYGLLIGLLLLLASCRAKPGTAEAREPEPTDVVQSQTQFSFPPIPATLTEPEARKSYLLIHYWEQFDFADTMLVNNRDVTEQGFVNFIALLADGTTPEELTRESLENWCAGFVGKEHARQVLTQTADDYLFNPNSPFYNEDLYLVYLKRMVQSKALDEAQKSTLAFKAELASRNRVGTEATDFVYYLPDGSKRSLKQTSVRGNRMILVFYDPECPSCHETLQQMMDDTALANAVDKGNVTVTAIYTEGNEDAWKTG